MRAFEAILRKLILGAVVLLAGPLSHMWWGYEYPGPGMNQLDLIGAVLFVSILLSCIFVVASVIVAAFLRGRGRLLQYAIDLGLFLIPFALAIRAGLSAQIVDV
jgi:hypothetical protein